MIEVDQRLIIALHEINLDAFDSPFFKLIERGLELIVERFPYNPQDDANILLSGIGGEFFHIDFWNYVQHVPQLVPAFIQDDVLQSIFRSEVDVIFVGLRVDAGFEIHAVDVVGIPPVPSHLAGPNPRSVVHLRWLS